MTFEPTYIPVLIFLLRVTNNVIGTLRLILVSRGQRAWSFAFASLESLLFAYTAGHVITDLENIPKLAAYVFGFAVGGFVGMQVENRFVKAYDSVTVIASRLIAHEIALALRNKGHGVTEIMGRARMARSRNCASSFIDVICRKCCGSFTVSRTMCL